MANYSVAMHVFRWIFVTGLGLSISQRVVLGQCSGLSSDVKIHADWWSILPYSTRRVENDNGTYTYNGMVNFVLTEMKGTYVC